MSMPIAFDVESVDSDTLKYNYQPMKNSSIDRTLQVGILVLTVGLMALLYTTIHEKLVNVGDSAPDFTITAENGKPVSLSNFGGKVLVLNFWATWCPPCVEEMPSLSKFAADFKGKGVVVLGVSVDKDSNAYKNFIRSLDPAFLTANDPEQKINLEYGTVQYPETYIIDSHGKVLNKIISSANWTDDKMVSYVQSLL
jgi:cytochrome c biogenesis protein CcmG/thiol:disulfide interchange protein DsbE